MAGTRSKINGFACFGIVSRRPGPRSTGSGSPAFSPGESRPICFGENNGFGQVPALPGGDPKLYDSGRIFKRRQVAGSVALILLASSSIGYRQRVRDACGNARPISMPDSTGGAPSTGYTRDPVGHAQVHKIVCRTSSSVAPDRPTRIGPEVIRVGSTLAGWAHKQLLKGVGFPAH
jgi:hypothetical protein